MVSKGGRFYAKKKEKYLSENVSAVTK